MALVGDKKIRKRHIGFLNPLQALLSKASSPLVPPPTGFVFKDATGSTFKDATDFTYKDN